MANAKRIRANFIGGVVDDNPLAGGAINLNSSTLAGLPPISATEHAVIVIDPNGVGGTPEIVHVTAHGAGATMAVIDRAKEGTTAREHAQGTPWVHSGIASDFGISKDFVNPLNQDNNTTLSDEFLGDSLDTSSWVRVDRAGNSANVTWTQAGGLLSVYSEATDNSTELHALLRPLGGASFPLSISTATRHMHTYATNYQMLGLIFSNGTTYGSGIQLADLMYSTTGNAGLIPSPRAFTGFSAETANYDNTAMNFFTPYIWHRFNWIAANTFTYQVSPDGVSWLQLGANISLAFTPTHAGVYTSHWGTTRKSIGSFEFFRIT